MEKDGCVGKFVLEVQKSRMNRKTKEIEYYSEYILLRHSLCVIELARMIKGQKSFDPKIGAWLHFVGTHWEYYEDEGEMSSFLEIFHDETRSPQGGGFQESFFVSVLRLLRYDREVFLPKISENFINFKNGVVDVNKIGERDGIVPATPYNSQTWFLPYNYNPTAWPVFFLEWLDNVFCGDKGKIKFVRAVINAIITRKRLQIFVHLKGKPRAGKGTLTRFIQMLLSDDSIVNADLETLGSDKFEMGRIYGKKLIVLNEQASYTDLRVLNMITGDDLLTSRTKHGNKSFDFQNEALVLMIGNNPLYLTKAEAAPIAERCRPVTFDHTIKAKDRAKFKKEGGEERLAKDLCGAIIWAGKMSDDEVYDTLLNPPASIADANRDAEREGNGLVAWIIDNLVYADGAVSYIGVGKKHIRNGTDRYGMDPDRDEHGLDAKLFPAYLAYCSRELIKNHLKKNEFRQAVIDNASRIFKHDDIFSHRDSKGLHIKNIRFKTDLEINQQ